MRRLQYFEASLLTWISWGHVPWVIGLTWLGLAGAPRAVLFGALVHLVGIFFALLGLGSGLCAVALVMSVVGIFALPAADNNAMDDRGP